MDPDPGFALYVHWPFCLSKCPYCDFNSHVRETVDQAAWRDALLAELAFFGRETAGRHLTSVFFGGGTPSLMAPDTVSALLDKLSDYWELDEKLEVTLEANPTSIEAARFRAYRTAGVNRVSVGVQALDDITLKFLGRTHSAREAITALEVAAATFDRFSFDLIYARPGQTASQWRAELTDALKLAGDHLSLYQLTIEPGTQFFRKRVTTLSDDAAADLFELTREIMGAAGRPAYEISNHARVGSECRHNLTYWRGGDYVGIGPGAHGRISRDGQSQATHQVHKPESWLSVVAAKSHGTAKRRTLSARMRAQELVMMGLRLRDGFDTRRIARQTGLPISSLTDPAQVEHLVGGGFLEIANSRWRATTAGQLCLDSMIKRLLT